jgi:hypothetical protein
MPLLKGALVEFMDTFLVPLPNVVVFQFNPETMTHAWTEPQAAGGAGTAPGGKSNPLAVSGVPGETFSFSLALDAADMIADGGPVSAGLAELSGVYSRLAALEMLQYPVAAPTGGGLLGSVSASIGPGGVSIGAAAGGAAAKRPVPQSQVPTVLFVWGPGRIVPVRVTALSVTEKLYDSLLNPTHADASITLRVLTPDELEYVTGPLKDIAKVAYKYSQGLRQVLAVANLGNAAESIVGMLPL